MSDYLRFRRHHPQLGDFVEHYLAQWQPYKPGWVYEDGCIFKGCLDLYAATGIARLQDFVWQQVAPRVDSYGDIQGYRVDEFNIDNINPGKLLFSLLQHSGESRFDRAIETQQAQLQRHPRTHTGNFWHKQIYPWQVWLDGLYMAQPFEVAYARLRRRDEVLDDVLRQFAVVREVMRDPQTGLYWHGWDESRSERWSDPRSGCSPQFWARAMGWFMLALSDCLEVADEAQRQRMSSLAAQFAEAAEALEAVRSPAGMWWQVLDQGARAGNYEEASASLMIAAACMKGARLGVLAPRYGDTGERAFRATLQRYLGAQRLDGICGVAGLGNRPYRDGSYAYYIGEPQVANDPKGVGALLMALAEMEWRAPV